MTKLTKRLRPENSALVVIDGRQVTLTDLPTGINVNVNLRVDQKTVSSINVVGPGYHHVGVKAVDVPARTLTIDDKEPARIAGKTEVPSA